MSKHLYFLGIGGTLMGSLAQLAKQLGFEVSGSDAGIYPPMSDQLAQAGITAFDGFDPANQTPPLMKSLATLACCAATRLWNTS